MTLERFYLYVESAVRARSEERKATVNDLVASIGSALSGKGLKKYLEELTVKKDGD